MPGMKAFTKKCLRNLNVDNITKFYKVKVRRNHPQSTSHFSIKSNYDYDFRIIKTFYSTIKKTLFVNILFFMYLRSYIHIHILKKVINIFTFQVIDIIGDSD